MTAELRTWARALTALGAAWVILKVGDAVVVVRRRRRYRSLHRSIVGAYAARRVYGSTPPFDAAIRSAEDAWLRFQPTSKGDLTE